MMSNSELDISVQLGDIDIDVINREKVISELDHVVAKLPNGKKHNTGIYVQSVPIDYPSGLASFDHKSEPLKVHKIDILNFSVLGNFMQNDHLEKLANIPPDWQLLKNQEFVETAPHIRNWFWLIKDKDIDNVGKLAMFLGLIRPGKEHLRNLQWDQIEKTIWDQNEDDVYVFKKSHAYGYALTIIAFMNLKSGL